MLFKTIIKFTDMISYLTAGPFASVRMQKRNLSTLL